MQHLCVPTHLLPHHSLGHPGAAHPVCIRHESWKDRGHHGKEEGHHGKEGGHHGKEGRIVSHDQGGGGQVYLGAAGELILFLL